MSARSTTPWRASRVSLAASAPPDDAKYPLFAGVRDQALVAELGAGDAPLSAQALVAPGRGDGAVPTCW